MFPKIVGFPTKSSILIGFSIIFTIHFGGFTRISPKTSHASLLQKMLRIPSCFPRDLDPQTDRMLTELRQKLTQETPFFFASKTFVVFSPVLGFCAFSREKQTCDFSILDFSGGRILDAKRKGWTP